MSTETDLAKLLRAHRWSTIKWGCHCGHPGDLLAHSEHVASVMCSTYAITPLQDAIYQVLSETYLPRGIDDYMGAPNRHLGGRRPIDAIETGDGQLVLKVARRIEGEQ